MTPSPAADLRKRDTGRIEVWQADLSAGSPNEQRFREVLSGQEIMQAERFHFALDRQRFVLRRAFRRHLLAAFLGLAPERLLFETGSHGKPSLAGGPTGLQFNCSASGNLALLAVTGEGEVGIDIERHRPLEPELQWVIDLFSPAEQAALARAEVDVRPVAFFECWVRKEAFSKALGYGLSLPLSQFTVSLDPGAPAALLDFADDPEAPRRWNLTALNVGLGFSAALAADRPGKVVLHNWSWPG